MRVLTTKLQCDEVALTEVNTHSTAAVNGMSVSSDSTFYVDTSVDLVVIQSVDKAASHIFENLSYNITIVNKGPHNCTNVTLIDILPSNVLLSSINLSQGKYSYNNGKITFYIGTVNKDSSVYITVTIKPKACGIIKNFVSASCNEHDINLNNNSCTKVTKILSVDA